MAKRKAPIKTEAESASLNVSKKSRPLNLNMEVPVISSTKGSLYVLGKNENGQLGLGITKGPEVQSLTLVPSTDEIVEVKSGAKHSIILTKAGEVFTFGSHSDSALGRNIVNDAGKPKKVELPGKVVRISAGDAHSACLLEDGRVFAFGTFKDSEGVIGLTKDGKVKHYPVEILPKIISVDIASGNNHLVILAKNGKVYTVGCGEQGQLGRLTTDASSGLSRRGNIPLLTPDFIAKKHPIIANAIWATPFATFVREDSSKEVYAFGLNNHHQLGYKNPKTEVQFETFPIKTSFDNVKAIAGGKNYTIVLKDDGSVFSIGGFNNGNLGLGKIEKDADELTLIETLSDFVCTDISCGERNFAVNHLEGKIYAWGCGLFKPKLLDIDQHIISVSAGASHSLFIAAAQKKVQKKAAKNDKENQTVKSKVAAKKAPQGKVEEVLTQRDLNVDDTVESIESAKSIEEKEVKKDEQEPIKKDESESVIEEEKMEVDKEDKKVINKENHREQAMETDENLSSVDDIASNASGSPAKKSRKGTKGKKVVKKQAEVEKEEKEVDKKEIEVKEQAMETDENLSSVDDNTSSATASPVKKTGTGIKGKKADIKQAEVDKETEVKEDQNEQAMETDDNLSSKASVDDNASNASASPVKKKGKAAKGKKGGKKRK